MIGINLSNPHLPSREPSASAKSAQILYLPLPKTNLLLGNNPQVFWQTCSMKLIHDKNVFQKCGLPRITRNLAIVKRLISTSAKDYYSGRALSWLFINISMQCYLDTTSFRICHMTDCWVYLKQ